MNFSRSIYCILTIGIQGTFQCNLLIVMKRFQCIGFVHGAVHQTCLVHHGNIALNKNVFGRIHWSGKRRVADVDLNIRCINTF